MSHFITVKECLNLNTMNDFQELAYDYWQWKKQCESFDISKHKSSKTMYI